MAGLFSFGIFTTDTGFTLIGIFAGLMVILWDWRAGVPGLILTQWGVGNLLVQRFNMPEEWAAAFLFLAGLSGLLLAISALQVGWNRHVPRAGILSMRVLIVVLASLLLSSQTVTLPIPLIDLPTVSLFTWLALAALLMLVLGDSPLHAGLGISLWLIPVYAVTAVLLPDPALIVLIGTAQLAMVLACSYLMLPASAPGLLKRPETGDTPGHIPSSLAHESETQRRIAHQGRAWLRRLRTAAPGGSR